MKKLNKFLCAILVLSMIFSSLVFTVSAEEVTDGSNSGGTSDNSDFTPTFQHNIGPFTDVRKLFETVNDADVEGNLYGGADCGNVQDIISVAETVAGDDSYIIFFANKSGAVDKQNPFYQLNLEGAPNISVEAGSTAYYVIDFDIASHGRAFSYLDVSVMLRRVSDGGGFPFSVNVSLLDYIDDKSVWSHVTIVGDIAANEVHLYVNGEYKNTAGYAYNEEQLSGNKELSPKGIRVDLALSSGKYEFDKGDNVALDNFSERIYTEVGLTDGLDAAVASGDIDSWSGYVSGSAGKNLPVIAKVGGVEYTTETALKRAFNTNDYLDIEFFGVPLFPIALNANSTINTHGMDIDSLVELASTCKLESVEGNIVTTSAPFTPNFVEEKLDVPGCSNSSLAYDAIKYPATDNIFERFYHNSQTSNGKLWGTPGFRGASLITNYDDGNVIYREYTVPNESDTFVGTNEYVNFYFKSQNFKFESGKSEYVVADFDFTSETLIEDSISLQLIPRNNGSGRWATDLLLKDLNVTPREIVHVTVVYDLTGNNALVFINGEYKYTLANGAINASGYSEYKNGTMLTCSELKLTSDHKFADIYFDNMYIRAYDLATADDHLKSVVESCSILDWEGNVFTSDYKMPTFPAKVNIDGTLCQTKDEAESLLVGNKTTPAVVKILQPFDDVITVSCDAVIYTYGQDVKFVDPYGNALEPVKGIIKYDAPYQPNRGEEKLSIAGGSTNADVYNAIRSLADGNLLSRVYFNSYLPGVYAWGSSGYRNASLVTNLDTGDVFYRESAILGAHGGMNDNSDEYVSFGFDSVALTYEEGKNEYVVVDFDFGTDGVIEDDIALELVYENGAASGAPIYLGELHVNSGDMVHITVVYDLGGNRAYVFFKGGLIYSVENGAMDTDKWQSEYLAGSSVNVSELKLCSDKSVSTVCFDNVCIKAYDNSVESDGILAAIESGDIADFAESVYGPEYVTSAIPTLAVADGVEYGSLEMLNEYLSTETEGAKKIEIKYAPEAVIKVLTDAVIETNGLGITLNWNTGIYEFEMDDDWYVSTETGLAYASSKLTHNVQGSVHTFETIDKDNCRYSATPVTWYLDAELTKYDVVFYVYGDEIAPLTDRTYVKGDKLYQEQWKAIELNDDGYAIGDVATEFPVSTPNLGELFYVYSPIIENADFAADDILVGAVVNTNIALIVYVAKSETVSEGETVIIDGVEYVALTFDILPYEVDKLVEAQFLVADADGNVYTQVYDICFLDYAKDILGGNYADADKKVVANLLAYANEAHALFDEENEGIEAVDTLLDSYAAYVTEAELSAKLDTAALSAVIRSASLKLNSAPEFVFKVAKGFRGTFEFSYISLGEEVKVVKFVDARVAEELVILSGLNVYDLSGDITITVTAEGASAPIAGQYNLASYAQSVEDNGFAKALLAYAQAAEEYMNN